MFHDSMEVAWLDKVGERGGELGGEGNWGREGEDERARRREAEGSVE